MMRMKTCTRCGDYLSLSSFSKHRLTKDGHAYQCKECNRARSKAFRASPSGIYTQIVGRVNHRQKIRNYHGVHISKGDFIQWYNNQPKQCAYCGITEENSLKVIDPFNNRAVRLTVDCKDNKIGYAKGNLVLACLRCNSIKNDWFSFEEMKEISQKYVAPRWSKMLGEV